MAAVVRSTSAAVAVTAGASVTVSSPSGSTTGDVLVAFVSSGNYSGSTPSTPAISGWTQLFTDTYSPNGRLTVFYRSWVSGSFTVTAGSGDWTAVIAAAVQGATTTGITYGSRGKATATTVEATVDAGSVTAAAGDALLSGLSMNGKDDGYFPAFVDWVRPSGMVDRGGNAASDSVEDGNQDFWATFCYVASSDNLSSGATGVRTWGGFASAANTNPYGVAIVNVLVPAAASGTTHTGTATITSSPSTASASTAVKPGTGTITSSPATAGAGTATKPVDGPITSSPSTASAGTVTKPITDPGVTSSPTTLADGYKTTSSTTTGITITPTVDAGASIPGTAKTADAPLGAFTPTVTASGQAIKGSTTTGITNSPSTLAGPTVTNNGQPLVTVTPASTGAAAVVKGISATITITPTTGSNGNAVYLTGATGITIEPATIGNATKPAAAVVAGTMRPKTATSPTMNPRRP